MKPLISLPSNWPEDIVIYPSPKMMPISLECSPMDADWKTRISDLWWGSSFDDTHLNDEQKKLVKPHRELIRTILEFGGEEVCMAMPEHDLAELKSRGVFIYGNTAHLKRMRSSQCHWNCAEIFQNDPDNTLIMTGYALSLSGCWRQHSWCVDLAASRVIETTTLRIGYFGFIMTREEADAFCHEHPAGG